MGYYVNGGVKVASISESLKELVVVLGFLPQDGTSGIYLKTYSSHDAYPIYVDFNKEKIDYAHESIPMDRRILLGDLSTSNFSHPENIVVLECVDRLLEKGYAPHCLELEKVYPSGRGHSGRLDILVHTIPELTHRQNPITPSNAFDLVMGKSADGFT